MLAIVRMIIASLTITFYSVIIIKTASPSSINMRESKRKHAFTMLRGNKSEVATSMHVKSSMQHRTSKLNTSTSIDSVMRFQLIKRWYLAFSRIVQVPFSNLLLFCVQQGAVRLLKGVVMHEVSMRQTTSQPLAPMQDTASFFRENTSSGASTFSLYASYRTMQRQTTHPQRAVLISLPDDVLYLGGKCVRCEQDRGYFF